MNSSWLHSNCSLTQSRFRPGAAPPAGTPGLCAASPADTPSRPSWQTLVLHTNASLGEEAAAGGRRTPPLTSFVTVGQFLRDPLDGFGSDFGAEVPVKR